LSERENGCQGVERQGPGLCCGREREKMKNEHWEGDQMDCREAGHGFSVGMSFALRYATACRGGRRYGHVPRDVLNPSPCLLSRKVGSGRFLLL